MSMKRHWFHPNFEPEQEEYYRWQDVTAAVTNEAPQAVWSQYYMAIARCQPSARRHQGAGRRRHPAAEGRQGRSAHLPCIRSFLSGQYVLSGLQSAVCVGRPWHPLHGEGRNDTQPQIHPRYAGRCLFQDRRRPDRGSASDHRRVLLGARSTISTRRPPMLLQPVSTSSIRSGTSVSPPRR